MTKSNSFAPLLERFFTQRLMQQRQASPHTISSYRDTFRQFLKFAQQQLHKPPSRLSFEEIEAPLIVAFLDGLEKRGLSVRSRNLRLTALHSFFRYAASEAPAHVCRACTTAWKCKSSPNLMEVKGSGAQGRRREAVSEGSVEQMREPMDKNRI